MVIVGVHRYPSWVRLLVVSFIWKLVWCFLVLWMLVLGEEHFSSVPVQGTLGHLAKEHGVISNRDLSSTSGRQPRSLLGNLESTTHAWCWGIC